MLDPVIIPSVPMPKSLVTLIQLIRQHAHMSPQIACQYVQDAQIQAADLMFWADVDHPVADSYGRHLVYDGGHFEIMVMSWAPGDFSAFHDHGSAQWGAVQSFGSAEHSVYHLEDNRLRTEAIMPFDAGSVIAVDHDLIHQMGNPSQQPFLSLHVYGRETQGPVTGSARVFDLWAGNIQFTDGGVFFCLPEELITDTIEGLQGDRLTTLRHHQQMLARIQRLEEPLFTQLQPVAQDLCIHIQHLLG